MIPSGYYIKARQIHLSWVAHAAPVVREVWDYLLREANHKETKYDGFFIKRGQLFRSFAEIREGLHWKVGYRKVTYSENQMKHCMKLLRIQGMIKLTSQPRGNLIEVLNYRLYQDPKNYESTTESTYESTNDQPVINQSSLPINKNDKNGRIKYREIDARFGDEFIEAFSDFKNMRVRMKKPMTEKAIDRMLKKMSKMEDDPIQVLIKSVDKGWTDVYPLKDDRKKRVSLDELKDDVGINPLTGKPNPYGIG